MASAAATSCPHPSPRAGWEVFGQAARCLSSETLMWPVRAQTRRPDHRGQAPLGLWVKLGPHLEAGLLRTEVFVVWVPAEGGEPTFHLRPGSSPVLPLPHRPAPQHSTGRAPQLLPFGSCGGRIVVTHPGGCEPGFLGPRATHAVLRNSAKRRQAAGLSRSSGGRASPTARGTEGSRLVDGKWPILLPACLPQVAVRGPSVHG